MKKKRFPFILPAVSLALSVLGAGCLKTPDESAVGTLCVRLSPSGYTATKGAAALPDSGSFLLSIRDGHGASIYEGTYGDSPERFDVPAGTYSISIRSGLFEKPAFSAPLYGDDQCVTVTDGAVVQVLLGCAQLNAGIRLLVDASFTSRFPDGSLYLSDGTDGLPFGKTEKRIAYFQPGPVEIQLLQDEERTLLTTRNLSAREILSLKLAASPAGGQAGHVSVAIDTARIWTEDGFTAGEGAQGKTPETALGTGEVAAHAGETGVWVHGYIAGCFKTAASPVFYAPFPSATNILIASRQSVTDKDACISIELKKGALRDAVNLQSHPGHKGRKIYVKGDIAASYYGIPGVKNVTDYYLEE